jgi:hypothetical protein
VDRRGSGGDHEPFSEDKDPLSTGDAPPDMTARAPAGDRERDVRGNGLHRLLEPVSGPRGSARTWAGSRWGDASTAGRPGSQGPAPAARAKAGDHENFGSGGHRPWQIGSARGRIEERPSDRDDWGNQPGDPRGSSPPFVASDFARTRPRNMACRATLRRRPCRVGVTCGCRHGRAGPCSGAFDSVGPPLLGIPTPRRGGRATSVGRGRVGEPSTGVRAIASIARPAQGDLP